MIYLIWLVFPKIYDIIKMLYMWKIWNLPIDVLSHAFHLDAFGSGL